MRTGTSQSEQSAPWSEVFRIDKIPDPTRPTPRGGIEEAITEGCEAVLVAVSKLAPKNCAVEFLMDYKPKKKSEDQQNRLSLFASVTASERKVGRMASLALRKGALADYYPFKRIRDPRLNRRKLKACTVILAQEETVSSPFGPELNPKIPRLYYLRRPLQPRESNTYDLLDRALHKTDEHVLVEFAVCSVDVSKERSPLARYSAMLDEINHSWGTEREEGFEPLDPTWRESPGREADPVVLDLPRQRDPVAESAARCVQKLRENLETPQLAFDFRVWAESAEVSHHIASVAAQSAFKEGSYRLVTFEKGDDLFEQLEGTNNDGRLRAALSRAEEARRIEPGWYEGLERLSRIASVSELVGAFRLPIGGPESPRTIRQNTDPPVFDLERGILLGHKVCGVGSAEGPVLTIPLGLSLDFLNRHLGVFAIPGNGKTWILCLIFIACVALDIPVLYYAPIRGEHLLIKKGINDPDPNRRKAAKLTRIYTAGKEEISPFRFNPLQCLPGITLTEHKRRLFEATKASLPMFPSFEASLKKGLSAVYRQYPSITRPPTFTDWIDATKRAFRHLAYEGEAKSNLGTAGEVRMDSLCDDLIGATLGCRQSIPSMDDLTRYPSIIEFEGISKEHTSLLIHLHLNQLRQYLTMTPPKRKGIQQVILIDECHTVAPANTTAHQSEESVNLAALSTEVITRFLQEMRKFKVAVVVADQAVRAVAEELVRFSGSFIGMRNTHGDERGIIGSCMNLSPYEVNELALLPKGEGYMMTEGFARAQRFRTPTPPTFMIEAMPPTDDELRRMIEGEEWFLRDQAARRKADLEMLKDRLAILDAERFRVTELLIRIKESEERYKNPRLLTQSKVDRKIKELRELRELLESQLDDFQDRFFEPLLGKTSESDPADVRALQSLIRHQFERVAEPDTRGCINLIEQMIQEWEEIEV